VNRQVVMRPRRTERLGASPLWYKDAIIYELRVRSFYDANGDGIGDFRGVTSKLDYLQDLGVTALWLLPFYPSPLRDDGYDIADYTDVHPDNGTLADFQELLEGAHRRGLRVITELVLNHTSDQHPWFKRARRSLAGSVERDFYVWSETPERYREARIIFKDFEPSNWAWDPLAKAYFWHRFYAHQPDLNFENPAVHEALLNVVDFWFEKGVDGMRLDAVPYLYEEEGTSCENLPATHDFIRKLRAHVDERFHDRMLLAEANQWPEDAAAYFGNGQGDECHMAFHFPIMPRMFMSIHMEDRFPILDILAQTPQLPESCQWALFLRNHDELTLEMVTDEERDYMYRAYARDNEMRINLGIRRRLAPLVGNDRRKMELLAGLLFSLPGTPVLYYGDEIGMGDNVFLGDRGGVRTPMQWSADRNAGFSRANPQRLILPIIIDPEYHYEAINVEAQQNNPNSLLWWTKRLIALRKRFTAFGRGGIEFLTPANYRVLAFVRHVRHARHPEDETVLVVANLSRFVQHVELDLARWKGTRPVELIGGSELPPVGEAPYPLTLPGHAFYWFSLEAPPADEESERAAHYAPPVLETASVETLLEGADRVALEDALPAFLYTRRWFRGHARRVTGTAVEETVTPPRPPGGAQGLHFLIVRVDYADGDPERYGLPLAAVADGRPVAPQGVLANVRTPAGDALLVDATAEGVAARAMLAALAEQRRLASAGGIIEATAYDPIDYADLEARNISAQHAAAAVRYGDRYLLKLFRHLEEGTSPELEMNRFLNRRAPGLSPTVVAAVERRRPRTEPTTLAVLEAYVANEGTAWTHAREELRRFFERILTRQREEGPPDPTPRAPLELARSQPPAVVRDVVGAYMDSVVLLGRRTAELHLALASNGEDDAFAPEPTSMLDCRSQYQSMRNLVGKTVRLLRENLKRMPVRALPTAQRVADGQEDILRAFDPLLTHKLTGLRIRTHGNYHLDEVLYTGKDFVIIDFDGPPGQTLADRRRKHSPLRDVAGMIRSFHFAAETGLYDGAIVREEDRAHLAPWADAWQRWLGGAFLRAYLDATLGAPFIPTLDDLALLLRTHTLEKAFTELRDELDRCADTVLIPLEAIVEGAGL
jgi:maltose alpha-D-glucosyltransferase/alpha-amylase